MALSLRQIRFQQVSKLPNGKYSDVQIWKLEDKCFDKGIKNGCPCIVEIRGTQGCALVGDPARAVGECRDIAKAQP